MTFYAPRYIRIRHEHLVRSLQALWRRQQGLVVAILAFMGPVIVGLGEPLGQGVARAVSPLVPWTERAAIVSAWLCASSAMVLSLREGVFMMRARSFLDVLPIGTLARMRADVQCVAVAYSLLWLPLAWALVRAPVSDAPAVVAAIAMVIAMQSTFAVMTWMRATAFAAGFGLFIASPDAGSLRWIAVATAAAWVFAVAIASHRARLPRRSGFALPRSAHVLAVRSALALPILFVELRSSMLLRVAAIFFVAIAGSAFALLSGQCGKAWGVYLVELVVFGWVLHRLPTMVDERARATLGFLFRVPGARRRAIGSALAVTMSMFIGATAVAAGQWNAACAAPDASRSVSAGSGIGAVLLIVSLASLRLPASSAWGSLAALAAAALLLGNAL